MTNVWLFGEMSINTDDTPKEFFKKACHIAESCGYTVDIKNKSKEIEAYNIIIMGEDCADTHILENYVNVWEGKISSLQKVAHEIVYKDNKTFKKMLYVLTYNKSSQSWKISFDCRNDPDLQKCFTYNISDSMPAKEEEDHFIPEKSNYDNDLDLDTVRNLMLKLHEAFKISAEGGTNEDVKWGDNDESDAISYIMSQIQKKYQDRATPEQRKSWRDFDE